MKETNPIYVQLNYGEALEAKKEILSSELLLLNLIKRIQSYNSLRAEELKIKGKIRRAVKSLGVKAREVQSSFPFLKIPQRIGGIDLNDPKEKRIKERREENLEAELKKIQDRLREIERR